VGVVSQGETCQVGCGVGSTSCTSAKRGQGERASTGGWKERESWAGEVELARSMFMIFKGFSIFSFNYNFNSNEFYSILKSKAHK
jgi:hypothetical protein